MFSIIKRYLAADMQLLCIFLFPAILMVSRPKKGLTLTTLVGLAGVCYTVCILLIYDAAPSLMLIPRQIMKVSEDLIADVAR